MVICPGCGAGMRFDIATQKLKCDFCGTMEEISSVRAGREARAEGMADSPETEEMTATSYSCPQCGGEILSMNQEAASFCSFCGASVVLEGKLVQTKKPKYMIPFQKTKEDCKNIYGKLTKRAWFAPKELKDPEYLERFRGIYLPFWTYDVSQKGKVTLTGTRESGNYTEHLQCSCDLDAAYDGISYDASSAFNDELCSFITPFNRSDIKDFHEGYMSGFYADVADVDSTVYGNDALEDANKESMKKIRDKYPGVHIKEPENMTGRFHTRLEGVWSAMYPVWFLTYRSKDRVAYAVVNGETGKIAADLPVDRRKFLIGSLLLALPIFLLITLLPTITAKNLLIASVILAVASFVMYLLSSSEIRRRELRLDDKGYQSKYPKMNAAGKGARTAGGGFLSVLRTILPLLGAVAGILIRILNPVSDVFYYTGTILIFLCICFTLTGLLGRFNLLTTRPIPELFEREGGDDRA